ncbi:hypothetical protein AB4186_01705 [Vibrio lentus]
MAASFVHQVSELIERLNLNYVRRELKPVFSTSVKSKREFIEEVAANAPLSAELQSRLLSLGALSCHLGSRQLEVFKVSDASTKKRLNAFFQNAEITKQKLLLGQFPFSIEDSEELRALKKSEIHILERGDITFKDKEYNFMLVSSVAEKEVKTVGTEYLTEEGLEYLEENNASVYVYSTRKVQLFHSLYWHADSDELLISVDRSKLSMSDSQDQLFMIRGMLSKEVISVGDPLNVFGAIEPLYNDVDGYVVKLGHVTTQSNPVRLTLKGAEKCLKKDRYHNSGESGGHVAGKFSVSKRWSLRDENENNFNIEVELYGKPAMLDTAQPLTDFAVIKCLRIEDLNFAIQNVSPHSS